MAASDLLFSVSLPAVADVFVNDGAGTQVYHVEAWQDEENFVGYQHGVGGNQDNLEVLPISRIAKVY